MRNIKEIENAEEEFFNKIWIERQKSVVNKLDPKNPEDKELIQRSEKFAQEQIKKYGLENLGPYDDFEWGMLSGKLSALRWVLGDEWDNLDT